MAEQLALSAAGVVVRYQGRPRLGNSRIGYSLGGVVHLGYGQAEPVPQEPEPFAAGPGDRLLQLPPVDEISRAGGGAHCGRHVRSGRAAWVFIIWCGMPVYCGLLSGLKGFAGLLASLSGAVTTQDRPQDPRAPRRWRLTWQVNRSPEWASNP
jgi:hypothetical protein